MDRDGGKDIDDEMETDCGRSGTEPTGEMGRDRAEFVGVDFTLD